MKITRMQKFTGPHLDGDLIKWVGKSLIGIALCLIGFGVAKVQKDNREREENSKYDYRVENFHFDCDKKGVLLSVLKINENAIPEIELVYSRDRRIDYRAKYGIPIK